MKTKAITHGLVGAGSPRPDGWSETFAARVRSVVLPGYTVFSRADARTAATWLLRRAAVRVKSPTAAGMRGQWVATTIRDIDTVLDEIAADDIAREGLVLELNLETVETLSVGHITVDDLVLSYHGTQRLTRDNEGRSVYGGSDLVCIRGGWEALERLHLAPVVREAITQARVYDEAALGCHHVRASVAITTWSSGPTRAGRPIPASSTSWRAGGASGADSGAGGLCEQSASPRPRIHGEVYGDGHEAPPTPPCSSTVWT